MWKYLEQESPPAWTQKAYRPPCIEYSFCCPTWVPPPILTWLGGGVPDQCTSFQAGHPPHPDLAGGVPDQQGTPCRVHPSRVPPRRVPSQLDLAGYPPGWTWHGTPPVSAPWHSGKCCKALWDMGTPPGGQTDWWKDRRVSKHYLPVVLRTRAVIKQARCIYENGF